MADPIVLDIATAPLEDAASYLEEPSAPANYRDPDKIAAYIAEAKAKAAEKAALDPDLCRITAIGWWRPGKAEVGVQICRDSHAEAASVSDLAFYLSKGYPQIIGYNLLAFDLPVLMRRAVYLGVSFPVLNLDRYRSEHHDLMEMLAGRDPSRRKSLSFYCRRLGWAGLAEKPLSGEDEALVFTSGRWDELAASVRRDVTAIKRLAEWLGLLTESEVGP